MGICYLVGAMGGVEAPVVTPDDCVIAVDGGYQTLLQWNIACDYVVGDFDSLGYVPQGASTSHHTVQVLPVRKDETDMEYALTLGKSLGYTSFYIQGGLGGRIDHSYGNFQLLDGLSRCGCRGVLLGEEGTCFVVREQTITLPPSTSGTFSVFALGEGACGVSMSGVSYGAEKIALSPCVPLGVSNVFCQGERAVISVETGGVLVLCEQVFSLEMCQEVFS